MANKPVRKRIFAKEQVHVDERTAGFRGSARPVSAIGDSHSRQVVGTGTDMSNVNAWRALSKTFDALAGVFFRRQESRDREAEKERDRQQRLMDARMQVEGERVGIEFNNKLADRINRGEIADFQSATDFAREHMHGLDPEADSIAFTAMEAKINEGLQTAGGFFVNRDKQALTQDNFLAIGRLQDAVWDRPSEDDPQEFSRALNSGLSLALQSNIPENEYYAFSFNRALSKMNAANASGEAEKAEIIRSRILESFDGKVMEPNGQTVQERVWESWTKGAFENRHRERQEEELARTRVVQARAEETAKVNIAISQAKTAEEVDALVSPFSGMDSHEMFEKYGVGGQNILGDAERQKEFLLTGRRPKGNLEALDDIQKRLMNRDAQLLYEDGFLDSKYGETLLPGQKAEFRQKIAEMRAQTNPEVEEIVTLSLRNLQKKIEAGETAYTTSSKLLEEDISGKTTLTPMGMEMALIFREDIRNKVNPADFSGERAEAKLLSARFQAANDTLAKIVPGNVPGFEMHKQSNKLGGDNIKKNPLLISNPETKQEPKLFQEVVDFAIPQGASPQQAKQNIANIQDSTVRARVQKIYDDRVAFQAVQAVHKEMSGAPNLNPLMDSSVFTPLGRIQPAVGTDSYYNQGAMIAAAREREAMYEKQDEIEEAAENMNIGNGFLFGR